ncbi:MAG TPA: 50S ribosomal protein L25/general stress protein Ctc [Chthoniobacteraceae bacterium]|jgi:large subunit ribosomal protein L25
MAKQLKLSAQTRTGIGRSAVNQIKKQGLVPAVIYGGKEQPLALSIKAREIGTLLAHATSEHVLVDLEIAGDGATTNRLALIQQVQHHPIKGSVLHVDFHAVNANEVIHAEIPVEPFGEASGVKNFGGLLELNMHAIEVECLPQDLPEVIRVDVSALNVGDAIHVKDLQLPAGVVVHVDADLTVVRVAAPKVEEEPVAGAAVATQPEVLKEKKEDPAAAKPAAKPGDKK